jgi:signal transduction histidine kinase
MGQRFCQRQTERLTGKEHGMQQTATMSGMGRVEQMRPEAVVETIGSGISPHAGPCGESVAELAHDARNMVAALGLYCDLLEEPGVLANPYSHYGSELRLVASASRRLVDRLAAAGTLGVRCSRPTIGGDAQRTAAISQQRLTELDSKAGLPISSLAVEILANHHLLAALAGPAITLTVDVNGGARPVSMTGEGLTRVLVNLVKNATEAMPSGGRIQIGLRELAAGCGAADVLTLTVEDNGPGIPEQALQTIFESGYTTRGKGAAGAGSWAAPHRGLGLNIARSIVEAAGGRIMALNRPQGGARFEIELPVRKVRE